MAYIKVYAKKIEQTGTRFGREERYFNPANVGMKIHYCNDD
jgi:hypothetical protein